MNKIETVAFREMLKLAQSQSQEIKLLKEENRRLEQEILELKTNRKYFRRNRMDDKTKEIIDDLTKSFEEGNTRRDDKMSFANR